MPKTSSTATIASTTYKMRAAILLYSSLISITAISLIAILTQKATYFAIFAILLTPLLTAITYLISTIIQDPIQIDIHKTKLGITISIEEKHPLGGWGKISSDSSWNIN